MVKRIAQPFPRLTLLPDCQGEVSTLIGKWVLNNGNTDFGLVLKANGEAESFAIGNGPALAGTVEWEANGAEFTLRQDVGESRFIYVGRISANMFIGGGWVGWEGSLLGLGGEWSATRR